MVDCVIIQGDFKWIHCPAINIYRLLNLKADPMETHDLINEPTWATKVDSLKPALAEPERKMADPPLTVRPQ